MQIKQNKYIIQIFAIITLLIINNSIAEQIVIQGHATKAKKNPGLYIRSFQGPSDKKAKLQRILQFADWFTINKTETGSTYTLDVKYYHEANQVKVQFTLRNSAGIKCNFTQSRTKAAEKWLLYKAVDTLIQKTFNNPGPCSSKIAYTVGQKNKKEIFTCNFDGTNHRRLTHNYTISTEPAWGKTVTSLVYTLYAKNSVNIMYINMPQEKQYCISSFSGLNAGAELTPKGDHVILCLSIDQRVDIYKLNIKNKKAPLQRLTKSFAVESSPTISADGRELCYVSDISGRPQIYLMPTAGGRSHRITTGGECVSPDWSPIARKICYSYRQNGKYVIAVLDLNNLTKGAKIINRPNSAGDWEAPSWAPDGRHIICSQTINGKSSITIIDSKTGKELPLTDRKDYTLPSWSNSF